MTASREFSAEPRGIAQGNPWLQRFARRLGTRGKWAFVLLAGVLTFLPAIRSPFILDDYMHAAMVDGTFCARRGPLDLYDFVNETDRSALAERGMLPWWSHPKLVIRFFRPLSSAIRWADQRALGHYPVLLHLHSLAWWALAVVGARRLFRRAFSGRVAWLATLMWALGPWHVLPLAWLANREALMSIAFGAFGLDAYLAWRDGARVKHAAMAASWFALSLLAGEYGVCFGGYVLAIELGREEKLVARAAKTWPFALPALAYLVTRAVLGYGTFGSAFYADPLHEPGAFLSKAPGRLVMLLAEGWLTMGTSAWGTTTSKWTLAAVSLAAAALAVVPLRRAFAAQEPRARASATWMLAGSLLALAPMLAVQPAPRVLGVSAIGMTAAIALLLDHAWFPESPWPRRGAAELTALVATALGFAQLVHGPIASWISSEELRANAVDYRANSDALLARLPDRARAEINVVRGGAGMFFGPFALDPGKGLPARWRVLAHTGHVLVLRQDARTIELIAPEHRALFPVGPGNLFRSEGLKMHVGDVIAQTEMRVTILDVGDAGVRRARFEFTRDLDAAPLVWIDEARDGFRVDELPEPGFGAPFDP